MHGVGFLQDLAVIMVVAGLVTVIFHRLKQPVVLGYILAGFIIGPHTPPFPLVEDEHTIEIIAELGVVLLMFSLGQHFSLRKLAQVGAPAVIAAVLEIVAMSAIGYGIGRAFGWSAMDSLFLGALLSISSTTIIVKALGELGLVKERFAQLIFGILIIEDILGIAMIALLSGIARTGSLQAGDVGATLGQLALFLVAVMVVGLLTVPRLLRYVARFRSNEMLLVASLGVCFGVSLLAAKLGYSVALGAFLAGAIVAEARESGRVEGLVEPVRDMFSAVFFVAIGMLIDPLLLAQHAWPIAAITAAVVAGKVLTCSAGTFLAGQDLRTSMRVGMGMAQIGEFSFIIAQLGLTLGVTSGFLYPVTVAVSVITTLLTPYLIKGSDRAVALLERGAPRPLLGVLDGYHRWVTAATAPSQDERRRAARQFVTRLGFQIALDLALTIALFIGARSLAGRIPLLDRLPAWLGGERTALWMAALLLALPMLVHAFGKMRALATLLAELGVAGRMSGQRAQRARAAVAVVLLAVGVSAALVLLTSVSLALLPPWPALTALVLGAILVVALLWRRIVQVYSRAQLSLRATLSAAHEHREGERHLTTLLHGAVLTTVELGPGAPAAGRLIRELQLRSATGATVVGIERSGANIVNPGPDEEIMPGDVLMLIGTRQHVDEARRLLTGA